MSGGGDARARRTGSAARWERKRVVSRAEGCHHSRGPHLHEPESVVRRATARAPRSVELLQERDHVWSVHLLGRQRRRLRARLASVARGRVLERVRRLAVARASARGAQTFVARGHRTRPGTAAARRPSTRRDRDRAPRSEVLASRFAPRGTRASREHSDAARVNAVERRFGLGVESGIRRFADPRMLGDADPYVVTRWFEQRFINLDRGSNLPLGSLAPACDPSGSEGVGTGEFADRTIVAYRSRLRLKVVVPSGSSRRGGVVGDDEARTASGGKPSSAKSPPLSVKG